MCVGRVSESKKKKKNRWGKGKKEGKNAQSAAKYNIDKGWILMRLWNERWTQVLLPSPPPPSFSQGICVECIAQKYKQKGILMFWFLFYLSICQLYSIVGAEEEDGSARKKDITLTADGCLMGELWETLFWFSAVSWGAINISYGKGESACMKEQVNNFFKCCFQLYLTEPPMHSPIAMIADYTTLSLSGCLFFLFSFHTSILLKEAYYCRMMVRK